MKYLAVVTTVASADEARTMARTLVTRRLAACVQVSRIESFYTWEGAVQNEAEYRVLCKTTDMRYEELEKAIREMHSYDLPAIHAFPFAHVSREYGEWIANETEAT